MSQENRQWLLKSRPVGMVKESDFELATTPIPTPGEGQLLIRNRMLAMEPAMRGWIDDKPNYLPPVQIGEVMRGMAAGEVIESNLEGVSKGDLVTGIVGWQEYAIGDASSRPIPPGVDPKLALSILGINGVTAYYGLIKIGQPKKATRSSSPALREQRDRWSARSRSRRNAGSSASPAGPRNAPGSPTRSTSMRRSTTRTKMSMRDS